MNVGDLILSIHPTPILLTATGETYAPSSNSDAVATALDGLISIFMSEGQLTPQEEN